MRKLMFAGLVGSSIEWYDFFIYGTAAALVFGTVFFPDTSPLIGTLLAFSTFWAGFVARPLGGVAFGVIGDRIGRKPAVMICLIMVTAGTFLIGCLPSASSIGVAAPILLVVLRFVQGIAVGGQWGGVVLLLTESAMPGRRGRSGSFGQMGVPVGLLLGTASFLIVAEAVPGAAFVEWGWRIPFLASALLLPVVVFIHTKVEETPAFRELKEAAEAAADKAATGRTPVRDVVAAEWRRVLLGAGVLFSSNAVFYVGVAGILDYGTRELGLSRDSLLQVSLLSSLIGVFVVYAAGSASDRFGRKPLMVAGAASLVLWAFPYFWLVDSASLLAIFIATLVGGIGSSLVFGPYAAFLGELFEPRVRYSGMSLAYQLTAILVSGGTPFIMTALLVRFDTTAAVSAYMALIGLVSLFCALRVPETHPAGARSGASRDTPAA
ncbi:MHS family MFS transporter [Streptomyces sp. MRC013]|uniref:MFS transporter n=1 Tax=Streptomyces sp. MRC013 TaxID=2898276 RepID=UPI0020263BE7|nr:MFS transporter [Streptomyces sp. MRC013]URM92211.1 MHS family MFS transporter [Streptomyces sp. MRC013]